MNKCLCVLCALLFVLLTAVPLAQAVAEEVREPSPREQMIDEIIEAGREVYVNAKGKAKRAHYSGDIYICKNFTAYVFNQVRQSYCMAEYPDVKMAVPANLPAKQSKNYNYGIEWENVSAAKGNPFYVAAQFKYDPNLSKNENMELALEFMRQVQRGDYFQMSAKYYYGVGAHSAIMIADYDPETDKVHWMDSNMKTKKIDGINYGYVQFDAEASITWWAEAFCQKKRGATLYRLREDIIRK